MSVERINYIALKKIASGQVKQDTTCVIKFYSNGCDMCHNLKQYYEDISNNEEYENIRFFALNVDRIVGLEEEFGFYGVPSIMLVNTYKRRKIPKIKILADPHEPNPQTFYKVKDIKNFINEHRNDL
mgnify:CR=1 FL=1